MYDRSRPEMPEVQALIQQCAVEKRARKAKVTMRNAELTVLGRAAVRAKLGAYEAIRLFYDSPSLLMASAREVEARKAVERWNAASNALRDRRAQS